MLEVKEEEEVKKVEKYVPPKPEVFNAEGFIQTLRQVQAACLDVKSTMDDIREGVSISSDHFKRMAKELRVEDDILTKSGKQVIPAPMRMYILNRCHEDNHVGAAKIYDVMKAHFYWPNMFNFVKNTLDKCTECVQGEAVGKGLKKDAIILTYEPSTPMEFITLDITHMPADDHDNKFLLL